jgi:hypothetical protein
MVNSISKSYELRIYDVKYEPNLSDILTISQSSHQLIEKPPIYEPPLTPSSEMTTIHQHQRVNQKNVHERESVVERL